MSNSSNYVFITTKARAHIGVEMAEARNEYTLLNNHLGEVGRFINALQAWYPEDTHKKDTATIRAYRSMVKRRADECIDNLEQSKDRMYAVMAMPSTLAGLDLGAPVHERRTDFISVDNFPSIPEGEARVKELKLECSDSGASTVLCLQTILER